MGKRWLLVVMLMLSLTVSATADNWGLGLRLGFAENNPKTMEEDYDHAYDYGFTSRDLDKNNALFGLEALYEWDLSNESEKVGVRLAVEGYGHNELKLKNLAPLGIDYKATESTSAYPITVYYKRYNGIKKWSWMLGAGLTIMRSKIEESIPGFLSETTSKTKTFPHIMVGAEYRISQLFALGLEARYNIAAKIKDDGDVISDRSGFGAALTGRFYF